MKPPKNSKDHGIEHYHHLDQQADMATQLKNVYAQWADQYDDDNDHKLGTVSQPHTVALLSRHCPDRSVDILDMGCGTGLVGMHLQKAGYENFDGIDLSADMIAHAQKYGYQKLMLLEANRPLPIDHDCYDVTLCVGVFTHAHLGPEGIEEMMRVTKPGGLLCFTVNEGVWHSAGFDTALARHSAQKDFEILEQSKQDYMIKEGVQAWYIAARLAS